jgi:FMN reductase
MKLSVVVGNPKPNSRTLDAAVGLARKLSGAEPTHVIDVITLGPGLLGYGDAAVEAARDAVANSSVVIFASPTYKATYTGLLKLFLDQFPANGLAGVIGLPVMMGAGPTHALAPELLLKPVLVELGAICPVQGLYLMEKTYNEDPRIDAWIEKVRPLLALAKA